MDPNSNIPRSSHSANMNSNLSQDEDQVVDGLDLSLTVGRGELRVKMVEPLVQPLPVMQPNGHQPWVQPPPVMLLPPQQLLNLQQEVQPQQFYQGNIMQEQPLEPQMLYPIVQQEVAVNRPRRRARIETPTPARCRARIETPSPGKPGKPDTVPVPFPWATNKRASIYPIEELKRRQILTISDQVQCKKCDRKFEMEFNLQEKFDELANVMRVELDHNAMRNRAQDTWREPILPPCRFCSQVNCVRPIISAKKKSVNWLFLLLGQMLGCLTLEQLKYYCKYNKIHRTGAKDRVLYSTYIDLFQQLKGH